MVVAQDRQFKVTNSAIKGARFRSAVGSRVSFRKIKKKGGKEKSIEKEERRDELKKAESVEGVAP